MDDDPGPSASELTDAQVSAIQAVADEARMRRDEIIARDPSVRAAMTGLYQDEKTTCLHMVRDAYRAAGVCERRAMQAAEEWMMVDFGVRGDLEFADELLADLDSGRLRRGNHGLGAQGSPSGRQGAE